MENKEKIQSITFEFETYSQTLYGEWAQKWSDWINSELTMAHIRSGNSSAPVGLHDNWVVKTKQQIRKEKLDKINSE